MMTWCIAYFSTLTRYEARYVRDRLILKEWGRADCARVMRCSGSLVLNDPQSERWREPTGCKLNNQWAP
jgi:hypothetical protein